MSTNAALTLAISFGAVLVSAAALMITYISGKRAVRSKLVSIAREVGQLAAKYSRMSEDEKYNESGRIEVLTQLAESLIEQSGKQFLVFGRRQYPHGVAIIFARALELFADYWWADKWWQRATEIDDPFLRSRALANWATSLADRLDLVRGRIQVKKAVIGLDPTLMDQDRRVDAYIVRGDAYRAMRSCDPDYREQDESDPDKKYDWFDLARREYQKIPDPRIRDWYVHDLKE